MAFVADTVQMRLYFPLERSQRPDGNDSEPWNSALLCPIFASLTTTWIQHGCIVDRP